VIATMNGGGDKKSTLMPTRCDADISAKHGSH
jgi:hypothetical protein